MNVRHRRWLVSVLAGAVALAGVVAYWQSRDRSPAVTRYPVAWTIAGGLTPSAESRSVVLELHDDRCASGVRAADRLRPARVVYGQRTVTITLTAELSGEYHTCPAPFPDNATIHLTEPLGSRALVDGSGLRSPAE